MSLPNYLAKIKSAGVYRFVWDKSQVPPQQAETLRLVVGYSEKGPFNTPVYIENTDDFKTIFGSASKRLERKGVYFHRLAEQALLAGPILALNIKPFTGPIKDESGDITNDGKYEVVNVAAFNGSSEGASEYVTKTIAVSDLYDTNRFWKLNEDTIPNKISNISHAPRYINIAATDTRDKSCSVFFKKSTPESYKNITFRNWYNMQGLEYPEYMVSILDDMMVDYFISAYVFRGEFNDEVCKEGAVLSNYFYKNEDGVYVLKSGEPCPYKEGTAEYEEVKHMYYTDSFGAPADPLEFLMYEASSNFINKYEGITVPYFKDGNNNYISLDLKFNADYNNHKMLMKLDEAYFDNSNLGDLDVNSIQNALKVKDDLIYANHPLYLSGYTYVTITKDTEDVWAKCADFLRNQRGLREALTNRVDVEYHYIVDTFDTNINTNKRELVAIAKEKDNAFAILNFPKMSNFVNDVKYFDQYKNIFDTKLVATKYQLPAEVEGASYCAFYTQLVFTDGTVKQTIPSAALVSNLFMEKWNSRQPYYIVAGPIFGRISYPGLVGPDYNFSRYDLDAFEPAGINAIVYVPRKGTYINSNQTAKQQPVSGLSKIHIRELVIYLQNEIEFLLQTYQWELNTQQLRDTIKSKADAICELIKNNGGIYEYINVCDETNNTPEVIDNEMIILNTEIEPARGAGKMVHQLTIHKTGALSSKVS